MHLPHVYLYTTPDTKSKGKRSLKWKKFESFLWKLKRWTMKVNYKFEKFDYKLRKAKLDISFLVKCQNENISLNFLKFCLAIKNLQNSDTYRKCQQSVLQTQWNNKKSHLRTLQNEFNRFRSYLLFRLNCTGFAHISAIFLISNDNLLKSHDSIQQKKT